jgi:hypothetical protein
MGTRGLGVGVDWLLVSASAQLPQLGALNPCARLGALNRVLGLQ